jgi:acetoacetyl-CoA synthetase
MLDFLDSEKASNLISLPSMTALWERLLGVAPIGADDDFFDLGGDSVLALQLFHEIERTTGRLLPITAIYEASTPARLKRALDQTLDKPFSPLVLLKPGFGEPLFIVHGIGGNVVELRRLGQAMTTPRPVYGIQARGVDGAATPLRSIPEMVEYYLPHVRMVQPHGPYFLCGYSFGGLVAMELARRLQVEGETIAFLGFIDSFPHPRQFPRRARMAVRAHMVLDTFRTLPFAAACRAVLEKWRGRGNWGKPPTDFAEHGANAAAIQLVYDGAIAALTRYRLRHYPGAVAFFRPAESIFPIAPQRVWGRMLAGLNLHAVRGDHVSMVREHTGDLAVAISRVLRDASANL